MSSKRSSKSKSKVSVVVEDPVKPSPSAAKQSISKTSSVRGSVITLRKNSGAARTSISSRRSTIKRDDPATQYLIKYCNQRKEFIHFVKTSGIKAAVVRAIVCLYEEASKPDTALEYIMCAMGGNIPSEEEINSALDKLKKMRERIAFLENENKRLKEKADALDARALANLLASEEMAEYEAMAEEENYKEYLGEGEESSWLDFGSCINSDLSFTFTF